MNPSRSRRNPMYFHWLPSWKGGLFFFGSLIILVLAYFYWQADKLERMFVRDSREHSQMLAAVIERNARSAILSHDTVREIIRIFLGNTARFVDYLDAVSPFSDEELAEFSQETGLSGIRIQEDAGPHREGPAGWLNAKNHGCGTAPESLVHLKETHLYVLTRHRMEAPGCVLLGLSADPLETLQEQIGLSRLLKTLSDLPGIRYVRAVRETPEEAPLPEMRLTDTPKGPVIESRIRIGDDVLLVGLDARFYIARTRQVWHEFFAFAGTLGATGLLFSWIFHRLQTAYLRHIREVEQELARQREDAHMGRAAAAIAHEIRNPLNAIDMGLQRLEMEVKELSAEHRDLVGHMRRSVLRTNAIVTDLNHHARPLTPVRETVYPDEALSHILHLYQKHLEDQSVAIMTDSDAVGPIEADPRLITQAIENLIKNSVEAQPAGGYLKTSVKRRGTGVAILVENAGFPLPAEQASKILEPYFSTKAQGTGLGLAIVRKIIDAHGGRLELEVPEEGVLRVTLFLPDGRPGSGGDIHENSGGGRRPGSAGSAEGISSEKRL